MIKNPLKQGISSLFQTGLQTLKTGFTKIQAIDLQGKYVKSMAFPPQHKRDGYLPGSYAPQEPVAPSLERGHGGPGPYPASVDRQARAAGKASTDVVAISPCTLPIPAGEKVMALITGGRQVVYPAETCEKAFRAREDRQGRLLPAHDLPAPYRAKRPRHLDHV